MEAIKMYSSKANAIRAAKAAGWVPGDYELIEVGNKFGFALHEAAEVTTPAAPTEPVTVVEATPHIEHPIPAAPDSAEAVVTPAPAASLLGQLLQANAPADAEPSEPRKGRTAARKGAAKGVAASKGTKRPQPPAAPAQQYERPNDDRCPLCNGDPSSQTWANEGVSCLCHECGKTWSVRTRKEVRTGLKIEKDREERNGVKRPSAGGLCAAVWDWLDANPEATIKELREVAPAHGWNANNVACEFYARRKFLGLTKPRDSAKEAKKQK